MQPMGYVLPALVDAEGEFSNWVFAQATDGSRILLVFDEDSPRLDDLAAVYRRAKVSDDRRFGALALSVDTLVELVRMLEDADPSLFEQAVLMHESDPGFRPLLGKMLSQTTVDMLVL